MKSGLHILIACYMYLELTARNSTFWTKCLKSTILSINHDSSWIFFFDVKISSDNLMHI